MAMQGLQVYRQLLRSASHGAPITLQFATLLYYGFINVF